jgi:PAS domain S-box-containing protein
VARILVVEDEGIVAKDIKDVLERMGHVVTHTVASGGEALGSVADSHPDLVLMDIVLRGDMDGVEAAERIRERFHVPVVYLTAYADDATLQRAKLAAPFGYILKPFEERDLRSTIEVALYKHRMERKLEKAALEWEMTFDSMEAPIVILDGGGRVARLNRAAKELAGQAGLAAVLDRDLADLGLGEPWRKAGEMAAEVRRLRSPVEAQVRDASSGKTWDLTAGPASDASGDAARVLVVARDVTRMIELQESLRRSETMSALGLLLAGVAHEVRNPLFSISANLDAFEAEFGTRSELEGLVTLMRTEVERLAALMRELLEYGRPAEPQRAPGRIDAVVADAVEWCSGLARKHDVTIANDVGGGLPQLLMDKKRLVQVLENLLQNAIQHSPKEGVVRVDAGIEEDARGAWVAVAVSDDGTGFAPGDLPQIFEPFFSRRRGGTGLGLAIAQRIVEEHGGTIAAANRTPGGARVVVKLPCVRDTDR